MPKPQMIGVIWWPHSGGRWFCRSLMNPHPQVFSTTFAHPWLYFSTDMTLELDITAQVHKARSMPDLKPHLAALKTSVDQGRIEGLKAYFTQIQDSYELSSGQTHIVGEMCLGSPIPRAIDLDILYKAFPEIKVIHLVRNPVDSFPSFSIRHEMDSDPIKVAGSWLSLNAGVRHFFEKRPDLKDQYLMVRYEDLLQDLDSELRKVCAYSGIEFDEIMTDQTKQRWGRNTKPGAGSETTQLIEEIAGVELKKYGYK